MFDLDRDESAGRPVVATRPAEPFQPLAAPPVPDGATYRSVRTQPDLDQLVQQLSGAERFAFDTETTSVDPMRAELVGLSIAPMPGLSYYIPVGHLRPIEGTAAATEME